MNPPLLGTVDRTAGAVHLERTLPAPVSDVWAALTDPARLGVWLGEVLEGRPGPDATFVLRMDGEERAVCTVRTWQPPHELVLTWDYTGEGPSQLRIALTAAGAGTHLVLEHERLAVDPVQYGAGWHVHLDHLAAHLGEDAGDLRGAAFQAAYRRLHRRYAEVATGRPSAEVRP